MGAHGYPRPGRYWPGIVLNVALAAVPVAVALGALAVIVVAVVVLAGGGR